MMAMKWPRLLCLTWDLGDLTTRHGTFLSLHLGWFESAFFFRNVPPCACVSSPVCWRCCSPRTRRLCAQTTSKCRRSIPRGSLGNGTSKNTGASTQPACAAGSSRWETGRKPAAVRACFFLALVKNESLTPDVAVRFSTQCAYRLVELVPRFVVWILDSLVSCFVGCPNPSHLAQIPTDWAPLRSTASRCRTTRRASQSAAGVRCHLPISSLLHPSPLQVHSVYVAHSQRLGVPADRRGGLDRRLR